MDPAFEADNYVIRRKVFTILDWEFYVYDAQNRLLLFSRQKAFKLKEDIRVYTDESMSQERLVIKARNIIDFCAASYDVFDSTENVKVGALRRMGWSSIAGES